MKTTKTSHAALQPERLDPARFDRRSLLKALPMLALAPTALAQNNPTVAVREDPFI